SPTQEGAAPGMLSSLIGCLFRGRTMSTNIPSTPPGGPPSRRGRIRMVVAIALLVAAGAGATLWWCLSRHQPKKEPDWTAVYRANTRGVGHMEQFKYEEAIHEFEMVVALAPDWWPGRVNLGIALLNRGGNAEAEAKKEGKASKATQNDFQRAMKLF